MTYRYFWSILVTMSSRDKKPLEKRDIILQSNEANPDIDIDETEGNMEGLKIEEPLVKGTQDDNSDESKQFDSPNQQRILTSKDELLNEPKSGPSGLQKLRLSSFDSSSDAKSKHVPLSQSKECSRTKGAGGSLGAGIAGADTDTTGSMSQSSLSSPPVLPVKQTPILSSTSSRPDKLLPMGEVLRPYFGFSQKSSSLRRGIYAADSANTSSDVSEMPSEIADTSAEGSVYHDAPETFEKEQTPSFESALEQQNSESSDTSISEIQEDSSTPSGSSVSISTPSGEGGYRNFIEECQREADELEEFSTSSGIGLTDQSEVQYLQHWVEGRRQNVCNESDSQNPGISEHEIQFEESRTTSEQMKEESITEDRGMQDFDRLFQRNEENEDEPNVSGQGSKAGAACRIPKVEERVSVSNVGAGTSSDPRSQSKYSSDSSSGAKEKGKTRSGVRPISGKKSKVTARKSKGPLPSSSESTEPKSTSSDESRRRESPEISSSESSISLPVKHQSASELGSAQISTMSSIETRIEGERRSSSCPELLETKDESPEKMETTSEEGNKLIAATPEQSGSKSSVAIPRDESSVFEAARAVRKKRLEVERKAGKSTRREAKLSTSPPTDQIPVSSPKKAAIPRPQKKAKPDVESLTTSETCDDSLPKIASTDAPKQRDSRTPSESDCDSPDETK